MIVGRKLLIPSMLTAIAALLPACNSKPKPKVVVHIYRDLNSPYARQFDHRMLDFQGMAPSLPSGRPIVLETLHVADYRKILQEGMGSDIDPEIIILDDASDTMLNPKLAADAGREVDICGALSACPAYVPALIPSKVTGEKAEAAQKFLAYLQSQQPPPSPTSNARNPSGAPSPEANSTAANSARNKK